MNLKNITRAKLLAYVEKQLAQSIPDGRPVHAKLEQDFDEALSRLATCINAVRAWKQDEFDYLHSSQYCTFLYFLANTIWRNRQQSEVPTKLFLLNKLLNGIDCFYEIAMPEIFFIGHSVGIVLAKAAYGNYLVLYQNSTVGKNHGVAPVIGERVVMYPDTAIIGRSNVRSGSVLSRGTGVINHDTPGDCLVFGSGDGQLAFKPASRDIPADFFRF